MNLKWKIFFLTLLIATIAIQGYSIYTSSSVKGENDADFFYIVYPLDYEPPKYWNLTEPDQYILEAIEHPGVGTAPFDPEDSTFWHIAIWDDPDAPNELGRPLQPVPFKYNGTYYGYILGHYGTRLTARILYEQPNEYWNLINPDKYTLNAINNPGKPAVIPDTTYETIKPYIGKTIQYNGTYYQFGISYIDHSIPFPASKVNTLINTLKPQYTAAMLTGAWIITGSIYIIREKGKEK